LGRAKAQYVLGYLYSSGGDVPVNYPLANRWLLQAATQGNGMAQMTLAIHLDNGQGIQRNKLKACGLLRVALKQTLPDYLADPMRKQLEKEEQTLSPQQLAETLALEKLYSSPAGLRELQGDLTNE
jgi:TPR repeat protein